MPLATHIHAITLFQEDLAAARRFYGDALGLELVYGPRDQPWGIRAALVRDPGGHLWELAS